jgi:hypothetical protein
MYSKMAMKIFLCLVCAMVINASSPMLNRKPKNAKYTSFKGIWLDNIQTQNPNVPLDHQTKSDAMQLYSIGSKQIVKVKDSREKSWEQPNYELSMTHKSRGRRDNKFVTETVSYQRLKIRSVDNQKYLCARTNGEIVFKESADKEVNEATSSLYLPTKADKKNKARKRCLFHWEFTKHMHIQLSLEAGDKKRYYLSVKDNVIKLREKQNTTEFERSFIWLPTGQGRNHVTLNQDRSRKFDDNPVFGESVAVSVLKEKDQQIEMLLKEVSRLKNQIEEIKGLEKKMESVTST